MKMRLVCIIQCLWWQVVCREEINQVDVWNHHSSATISIESKSVEDLFHWQILLIHHLEEFLPFVANDFSTGETSDWNDHFVILNVFLNKLFYLMFLWYFSKIIFDDIFWRIKVKWYEANDSEKKRNWSSDKKGFSSQPFRMSSITLYYACYV